MSCEKNKSHICEPNILDMFNFWKSVNCKKYCLHISEKVSSK